VTSHSMQTQRAQTLQYPSDEKSAIHSPGWWRWVRVTVFWTSTFIVVFELAAGSVWNLWQIEWVRLQLIHLGYPLNYTYITGFWQAAGAAAIIAPRFPRLKEWAYAGAFFTWSGAVASHLFAGDGAGVWSPPLMFAIFGIMSWALRPAGRRLPDAAPAPQTEPLEWAVPIGALLLLFVVSYVTLPWANAAMHARAVSFGWIGR